jgi:hypothetical protein
VAMRTGDHALVSHAHPFSHSLSNPLPQRIGYSVANWSVWIPRPPLSDVIGTSGLFVYRMDPQCSSNQPAHHGWVECDRSLLTNHDITGQRGIRCD